MRRPKVSYLITLKALREESGKTRKEVAEALGVSVQAVSHYENGIRRIRLEQVLALTSLYETTAEEVIEAQINSQKVLQDNLR